MPPIKLNAFCSLMVLLLLAAASFAQGDEKLITALAEQGIPIAKSFRPGAVADRSATARINLGSAVLRDIRTMRPVIQTLAAVDGWKLKDGELRLQRSFEFSRYLLLCVAVNESGKAVWLSTLPDPRTIRAEVPDESGNLTGLVTESADAELLLTIPADPAISEVKVFESEWRWESHKLAQIGSLKIAAAARFGR